jgi:dolichol-phosphate mannosyltransferase
MQPVAVVLLAGADVARLAEVAREVRAALGRPLELVVVTDGAPSDRVATALAAYGEDAAHVVRGASGWGARQRIGLREALARRAERVLVLAADGRHDPADATRLLDALDRSGADAAIGARSGAAAGALSLTRRLGAAALAHALRALSGRGLSEFHGAPRAWRREALTRVDTGALADGRAFDVELLLALLERDAQVVEVPTAARPGERGPAAGLELVAGALRSGARAALARARNRLAFAGPADLPPSAAPSVQPAAPGARRRRVLPVVHDED